MADRAKFVIFVDVRGKRRDSGGNGARVPFGFGPLAPGRFERHPLFVAASDSSIVFRADMATAWMESASALARSRAVPARFRKKVLRLT